MRDFPAQTIRPLNLTKPQRDKLTDYLDKELARAEHDRSGLERKWKAWRKQADSRRERKGARARDAKIDMPLTRERMIQDAARQMNPIFQQDQVYTTSPKTPGYERESANIEAILDQKFDKVEFRLLLDEFIEEFQTVHAAIFKTPFVEEVENYKQWDEISYDEYVQFKDQGLPVIEKKYKDTPSRYFVEVEGEMVTFYGCRPEVVKLDDFWFPITAASIESADWVSHRVWLTKSQVRERIRQGVYDKGPKDARTIEVLGEPQEEKPYATYKESENSSSDGGKQYALHEVYLRWSLDPNEPPQDIIVVYDRKSKTILRAVYNFFHSYRRPFIAHSYKHIHGSILGVPLTYLLEPLHIAYSASFQQRLDAASKANEIALFVPPGSKLLRNADQEGFHGGVYETTGTKEDFFTFNVSQPFTQLPDLESRIESAADRLIGLSGYSFGQEQISRPTATGQIQVIEEGKQPQYVRLEQFRKTLQKLALHVLSRERQFNPDGMVIPVTMTDPQTGEDRVTYQPVSWPDGPIEEVAVVEIKVTSAQMSKNLRKQEITALADKIPQMYQVMMGMAQTAVDPNNPVAMISAKLLNGYQAVIDAMLTEFEVPKKGKLNPELIQEVQVAQQIQGIIQQLHQQVQGLGMENQQLKSLLQGMGPPPRPAGGPGQGGGSPMAGPPIGQPGGGVPQAPPMPPQR